MFEKKTEDLSNQYYKITEERKKEFKWRKITLIKLMKIIL